MSLLPKAFELCFEIQSYWHVGSGHEAGGYADALVVKDAEGLPYIPGKGVKGVLKEAFQLAEDNNWFTDHNFCSLLFGKAEWSGASSQGLLQISNAQLSPPERAFFQNNPEAKNHLFKVVQSTAIDSKTGVAKEMSLRSTEVVVPMNLVASLELNQNHPEYQAFQMEYGNSFSELLNQCVALIFSVGAKRHRGFGDVIVSVNSLPMASQ